MEHCFGTDSTISTSLIAVMPEHEIHKIYPPGVGSAPSSGFVPAVVCDDFVFVAGQMAHNAGQGLDPRAHKMADLSNNELHTGPITFMGTAYTHDLSGAKASVLRVPFDCGVHPFQTGSRQGPAAVRGQTILVRRYSPELAALSQRSCRKRPERSTTGPATCCAATTLPEELPYSGQTRSAPWRQVEAQN
jgi:hypothetical protein